MKASLTKLAGVSPKNATVVRTDTTSAPHANIGVPGGSNGKPGGPNALSGGPQKILLVAVRLRAQGQVARAKDQAPPMQRPLARQRRRVGPSAVTLRGFPMSVPVIRVDGADGKPLAVLMNVAVRSVVMDGSKDSRGSA